MILTIEDYKKYVEPIISETENNKLFDLWRKFSARIVAEKEEHPKTDILHLFNLICSLNLTQNATDDPFHPSLIKADGSCSGEVKDISSNHQNFLKQVVDDIQHNDLRARVLDIIWIKEKHSNNLKRAVDAYMVKITEEIKNFNIDTIDFDVFNKIYRVIFLVRKDKQSNTTTKIVGEFENIIEKNKEALPPSIIAKLLEILSNLAEFNLDTFMPLIEEEKIYIDNQEILSSLIKLYQKRNKQDKADFFKFKLAEVYAGYGDSAFNTQDYLSAQCAYRKALQNHPESTDYKSSFDQINAKLSNAAKLSFSQMNPYNIPIPEELYEKIAKVVEESSIKIEKDISNLTFPEALKKLLSFVGCPSYEEIKKETENEKRNLFGIFSSIVDHSLTTTVNDQARVQNLGSGKNSLKKDTDESVEENLREYFKMSCFPLINILDLNPLRKGLDVIISQHTSVTLEDWKKIFKDCSLIPEGRINSYVLGFYHWFKRENLIAIPILIPQFENFIRFLKQNAGEETSEYKKNEGRQDEGGFKANLNDKIIQEKLGPDLCFIFRALLIEKGFNIRNDVTHGLIEDQKYDFPEYEYFTLLFLKCLLSSSS